MTTAPHNANPFVVIGYHTRLLLLGGFTSSFPSGLNPLNIDNTRVDGFLRLEATIVSFYLQQAFRAALLILVVLPIIIYI